MKKLSYLFTAFALASVVFLGCKKESDPEPDECADATFPSTSGTATINFKNSNIVDSDADGVFELNAAAGDYVSIAVEVIKGTNRPQKLRAYQSDCVNKKGDAVSFAGQPDVAGDGVTIDLRNTDSPQIRTVGYTVPTGFSTLYLNFETDESGNTFSYKRIKLNISGSGIIDSWTNVILGGNTNANASRLGTGTGQTFTACDAAANIQYIDVTYAVALAAPYNSYLCSNPARFAAPISLATSSASCGEDGTLSTAGGTATYFKVHAASDFATIDDAGLTALTVSSSDNQYVQVTATGTTYEFLNSNGKKGLIKVLSGTLNDGTAAITVDVKVQR